jgi:TP901 family phage tail tape measure protein
MADISLKIKSDFDQAEKDFRDLENVSESTRKQMEKFQKSFKSEQIDKFAAKNKLAATAVTATQGKLAGMQREYTGLQRKIQSLISNGMSPQDEHLKKLTKSYDRLGQEINQVQPKQSKLFSGGLTKMIAYAGGIALVTNAVRKVVSGFINFDQAITSASAKFKGLNLASEEGQKTFEELKKTARAVGAETEFSAAQAAGGLDFLAMAGFNATQSMSLLPEVVDLATVASTDLARATDIASDSLGAFGMMTDDSTQLAANFARVNDVMAKTITTSNTSMEDLFEAIKKGAPTFTSTSQSIETFNTLIGVMANSGVKGSEAGTQLRNMMLRLANPTNEAAGLLNKLNITTRDSQGDFRDAIDILADFEVATKDMGTAERAAALETIFGARAITGINILLAEGSDKLRAYRGEIDDSAGSAKEMAEIMRGSLANQLKALGSAALELGFAFIDAFSKQGSEGIKTITEAVRALTPVFTVLGQVFSMVVKFLPSIIAGFVAYSIASKAAALSSLGFVSSIRALTVAMAANPIGLIATVISAVLVPAIIWMVKNWDLVKFHVIDFALAARQKMLQFSLIIQEKVTGAILDMLEKFRQLPLVGKAFGKLIDYQRGYTDQIRQDIKVIEESRESRRAAFEELMEQKEREIEAAKQKGETMNESNMAEIEGERAKTAISIELLQQISDARDATHQESIEKTQEYFAKQAEIEANNFKYRQKALKKFNKAQEASELEHTRLKLKFLKQYLAEVKSSESINANERIIIERGLRQQIEAEQKILNTARKEYMNALLTETANLITHLQTIQQNAGKESRKLAIAAKGIAMAQAAINTFLSISKVWAQWGWPLGAIFGAVALAAGIAQQVAIATTPIPAAQTGLMDYTVPDTRTNRNDNAAVMASPGERVSITPRSEEETKDISVSINVNEDTIFSVVQRGIETGKIMLNDNNIGRSVFAQ